MPITHTLAIIKPLAVQKKHTGAIITQIEANGFVIRTLLKTKLSLEHAQAFYAIHAQRSFYNDLCTYMASDDVIIMVLEKENAIQSFRALIGHTDPTKAAPGTLRQQFGTSIDYNGLHGSDAPVTAEEEIQFFFGKKSCCGGKCS